MFFRLGRYSYALIIWSILSLLWMSEFHPFAIAACAFAFLSFFFRDRVELSNRGRAVVALVCLLVCFICTRTLGYLDVGKFLGIGTMSLSILGVTLIGCLLITKRDGFMAKGPHFAAAGTLVGCSMSGDLVSVAIITVVGILLIVASFREAQGLKTNWRMLPPLLFTMMLAGGLALVATWSETRLSFLMSLFQLSPPAGISFPAATSLRSLQRWSGDDVVVMRGYGSDPPLYLVGRTFTEFDDKSFWRWNTEAEEIHADDQVLEQTPEGEAAVSLFNKSSDPEAKPGSTFRMEYPKGGYGYTFYAPRHLYGIAVDVPRLQRFNDGMLQAQAKDETNGNYYLVPYADGWEHRGKAEALTEEERQKSLELPKTLTPEVARLAREICGDVSEPAKKADLITGYLQKNFTYGYDYPFKSDESALEEFLIKRPPVHCEFFATAGALMMRSQGIPTRYINGFVMQERSLVGNYYVVRLKHAHAWVEAYLPGRGWTTFDPTPPGTLENVNSHAGAGKAILEFLSNMWRKFFSFFDLSPMEMLKKLRGLLSSLTWADGLKLLALGALYSLWKRYRSRKRGKKKVEIHYNYVAGRDDGLTPAMEQLMECLSPEQWRRQPAESPQQWLERLRRSDLDSDTLQSTEDFVKRYCRARYGKKEDADSREVLQQLALTLQDRFKGKSLEARERREPA